jgi:hypothetical protein
MYAIRLYNDAFELNVLIIDVSDKAFRKANWKIIFILEEMVRKKLELTISLM